MADELPSQGSPKSRGKRRTAWHPLFVSTLRRALPPGYEILPEYPLLQEPQRIDVVVIRKPAVETAAPSLLPALFAHLGRYTLIELKGPSDDLEGNDIQRLLSYAFQFCVLLDIGDPVDIRLLTVSNRVTGPFRGQVARHGGVFAPVAAGVHEVSGLPFSLCCLETEEASDHVLHLFSRGFLKNPRLSYGLLSPQERLILNQVYGEARRMPKDAELLFADYEEFVMSLQEFYDAFLSQLTPEERLKGLSPEQVLRQFSPEQVLRQFSPEQMLKGLSPEALEQLRRLLAR